MTPFGFVTPARHLVGRGTRALVAAEVAALAGRAVLVRGTSVPWADTLADDLAATGVAVQVITGQGEPTIDQLRAALDTARPFRPDCVVAVGGGAVLDLGKALAALMPGTGDPVRHFEVVGEGRPLDGTPLPFVAVPTTAGTGAEATRNAVIGMPGQGLKVSLRDPRMVARLAVVDPALTDGAPRAVTLASGLDAVTQLIEPYLSCRANILTDALCRDAIPQGIAALVRLVDTEDPAARDALARTSFLGGIALSNAGLGAVHGLAGVIGGRVGGAHGAICGRLLVPVLRANHQAMSGNAAWLDRLMQVHGWLFAALPGRGDGVARLADFVDAQDLPRLGALGVTAGDIPGIAEDAARSSSMKANPVALPAGVLEDVLRQAL